MNLYLILFLIFLGWLAYYYFFLWCQYDIGECRCDEEKMPYSGHLDGGICCCIMEPWGGQWLYASFAPRVHLHVLLAVPKPLVGQEDHEGGVAATGGGTHPRAQQGARLGENAFWPHREIHARRATDSLTLP
jgi:hypothetical protein